MALRIASDVQLKAQEIYEQALALDPDELRKKADEDKFYFARVVMGNVPVFPEKLDDEEAKDWVKLFKFDYSFGEPGGVQNGVNNAPRNSLKTTILVSRCADWIAHDRNIRILYTTNTHENAMNFSRALQGQLSGNDLLKKAYGEFVPDNARASDDGSAEVWRQDYFTVSGRTANVREPTFTASSVGKTQVGMHYDIIIFDDVVDQKNSLTAEGLQKTIAWFALATALVDQKSKYGPGGCILVQGTRYADGDLYGWLLGEVDDDESPSDIYDSIVLRAMENPQWDPKKKCFINPVLNFPHILDEKRLAKARRHGAAHFSMQYQNECITPEDAVFRPEWFRIVPAYTVPEHLKCYLLADIAFGLDDSNDRTALWVVGLGWKRTAWCIDFDVGRWSLAERCDRIITLIKKHNVEAVGLEQVVSNESVRTNLQRLREDHRLRFRIVEIGGRSTESKKMRITSLQPRFEAEDPVLIWFVERDPNDWIGIKPKFLRRSDKGVLEGDIANEFLRFPKAIHDDIPDALSDIDKIDKKHNGYYFTEPGDHAIGGQLSGPSMVNGRVVARMGVNNVRQDSQQIKQETDADFFKRHASRLRGNY